MSLTAPIAKGLAVDSIDLLDQAVIHPNRDKGFTSHSKKWSASVSKTPVFLTLKVVRYDV